MKQEKKTNVLQELEEKQKEERAILRQELEIQKEVYNITGHKARFICLNNWKKPSITFKADTLKEVRHIFKALKPLNIYWVDNGFNDLQSLEKYEKQIFVRQDKTELTGLEHYKEEGKFFNILNKYVLKTSPTKSYRYNHSEIEAEIEFYTDKYRVSIEFNQELIREHLHPIEEKDEYETEQARQYNPRHADITRTGFYLDLSDNENIKRVNFYGGNRTHFAISPTGTKAINKVMGF